MAELISVDILYNGNCLWKKKFANFAKLEAFVNVFLHFYLGRNFLYLGMPFFVALVANYLYKIKAVGAFS